MRRVSIPLLCLVAACAAGCAREPSGEAPGGESEDGGGGAGGGGGGGGGPPALPRLACGTVPTLEAIAGETASATVRCAVSGAEASVTRVEVTAPFTAVLLGAEIASPGESLELEVTFAPVEAGAASGTVTLHLASFGEPIAFPVAVTGTGVPAALRFDPFPAAPPCRLDPSAPLLAEALAAAGLTAETLTFEADDLSASDYQRAGFLDDDFRLPWFTAVRGAPLRAGCFEGEVAGALDRHLESRHPVAGMIREASRRLGREVAEDEVALESRVRASSFAGALDALCAGSAGPCETPEGDLPGDVQAALAPILALVDEALQARAAMAAEHATKAPAFWWRRGGAALLGGQGPQPGDPADRAYLLGSVGRARLEAAAARLAFAIEETEWDALRDREGVTWDLATAAGAIRVRGGEGDLYEAAAGPTLLLLDLGGDDVHLDAVAANASPENAVSVAIDLGGNDVYGYDEVATAHDREGLLPADEEGRVSPGFSVSQLARQGGARNGVALLFDLGAGRDEYRTLRGGQGYAHQGVGVLFDGGGDDRYLAEAAAQGAAQYGIGLLVDAGAGRDERRAFAYAQGFGYVGGYGALVDGGGDDVYFCDPGDPDVGGIVLYPSPQLPGRGNTSMCQGAGYGMRGQDQATHLSGGLGVLRDQGGDDTYDASVFAQGTGYWQGTGLLSDGGGADRYDAYWYVQGGAAHYAVGILADAGAGDDRFDTVRAPVNMALGAGHDFSVGALIEESGDETYVIPSLAAGASHCNGIGLFVDGGGADSYDARSDYAMGAGSVGGECLETRPTAKSVGIFLDGGGVDSYVWPAGAAFPAPSDGGSFGQVRQGLPSEHGAGLDREGDSSIHAESAGR